MSTDANEVPSAKPKNGSFTILELFMAMMVVALFFGFFISNIMATEKMEDIERIVRAEAFGTGKSVESCSILIDTQRREGKCGTFGKYTVLKGGRQLYVYDGPADEPHIVGGMNLLGLFVANKELEDFALKD